jgi:hypothetical protein
MVKNSTELNPNSVAQPKRMENKKDGEGETRENMLHLPYLFWCFPPRWQKKAMGQFC